MTLLLASVGWGLLTIGAVTHIWHHRQLRRLLAMHLDRERLPALVLTAVEGLLALAIPIAVFADSTLLIPLALGGLVIAVGFIIWIARLLITNSTLPCACSFSTAPTSPWSLARACCVALVGLFAFVEPGAESAATTAAVIATALGLAAAIFVVPESLAWPSASRALLARVDAYDPAAPVQ